MMIMMLYRKPMWQRWLLSPAVWFWHWWKMEHFGDFRGRLRIYLAWKYTKNLLDLPR